MAALVTLYVKHACPYCDRQRDALGARGARVNEIDVTRHPEVVPELLKLTKGRRIVPVIVEGARILVAPDGGSAF